MLAWRYGITVDGSRFARRARRAPGTSPGHRPVFGADNPDASEYETEIRGLLAEIETTGSGRAVLESIAATRRAVRILPLTDRGEPEQTSTAAYETRRSVPAGARMLDRANQPLRMSGDDRATPQQERRGDEMTGLGGGSDSFILFSPNRFSAIGPDPRLGVYLEPVVMLFHELVHALFMAQGHRGTGNFGSRGLPAGPAAYLNEMWDTPDEFFAIVVENILASELDIRGLRGAHARFSGGTVLQDTAHTLLEPPALGQSAPTSPGRAPSMGGSRVGGPLCPAARRRPSILEATPAQMFAWEYASELRMFRAAHLNLWRRLASVFTRYNPVREVECGNIP